VDKVEETLEKQDEQTDASSLEQMESDEAETILTPEVSEEKVSDEIPSFVSSGLVRFSVEE
jgi:hypothetical protein